jgi:beta-lactam-binding protein with PASTA domain
VFGQDPPSGRPTRPGTVVTMTVADGPPRSLPVPNVLGEYADQAATALRGAGFQVSVLVRPEPPPGSPERAGKVWRQTPITAELADEGATVTITVNP